MNRARRDRALARAASCSISLALLALALGGGCGQKVEVGFDDPPGAGGAAGYSSGAVAGTLQLGGGPSGTAAGGFVAEGGAAPCSKTLCRGKEYQCGNCSDDDGDGLVDALDPDCLGPCDDDEVGLSTGLAVAQSAACRQDCYFDGDHGAGNDKCEWSHACDPLSVAPDYPPSGEKRCKYDPTGASMGVDCVGLARAQSAKCTDTCLPLVPNGCDCFGCCELPGGSGNYHFIGAGRGQGGCERGAIDDPVACPQCTPVPSCFNDCATCETCVDRAPDPSCGNGQGCPNGARDCGPDAPCDFGDYCVTGCCVKAPPPT